MSDEREEREVRVERLLLRLCHEVHALRTELAIANERYLLLEEARAEMEALAQSALKKLAAALDTAPEKSP